jgi:mono/diheme cytochrome c family protein
MKRAAKWFSMILGAVVALLLVAIAALYASSEVVINRTYDVALLPVVLEEDSLSLAEGQRLATLRGCYDGCHGPGMDGAVFFDEPGVARLVAPNLTQAIAAYTDEELARLIRFGVKHDGRSSVAMPTGMLYHLSDRDLSLIISFLRSAPRTEGPASEVKVGPIGRVGIVTGLYPPSATQVDPLAPRFEVRNPDDHVARGRYLALTVCVECHGADLEGFPAEGVPGLSVAAAYPGDDFERLMRTGIALGDREIGLMSAVSRSRFAHFTDEEVSVLHAYLRSLASQDREAL